MKDWEISIQGAGAYRSGFCLPKIIVTYADIWSTTAILGTCVGPATCMAQASPVYQRLLAWVKKKAAWNEFTSPEEAVETLVKTLQGRIAGTFGLVTLAVWVGVTLDRVLV